MDGEQGSDVILTQLARVRASGLANMLDRRAVQAVAHELQMDALERFAAQCGIERRNGGDRRWVEAITMAATEEA